MSCSFSSCTTCSQASGCGWCTNGINGQCEVGSYSNSMSGCAGSNWVFYSSGCSSLPARCPTYNGTSCTACAAITNCGWCGSNGVQGFPNGVCLSASSAAACSYSQWQPLICSSGSSGSGSSSTENYNYTSSFLTNYFWMVPVFMVIVAVAVFFRYRYIRQKQEEVAQVQVQQLQVLQQHMQHQQPQPPPQHPVQQPYYNQYNQYNQHAQPHAEMYSFGTSQPLPTNHQPPLPSNFQSVASPVQPAPVQPMFHGPGPATVLPAVQTSDYNPYAPALNTVPVSQLPPAYDD